MEKRFTVCWSDDAFEWVTEQVDDLPPWRHPFMTVTRNNLSPTATYATRACELDYRKMMAKFITSRC